MQLVSYNSVLVTKQKYRMHLMEKKRHVINIMSVSLYDIYLQCFISDVTLHHAVGARALNKL